MAAGPLPNSRWIEAYARLGYGLLTYRTVLSSAQPALGQPNLVFCRLGDPALAGPGSRRPDPASVTWAVSFGLPSLPPEQWRPDVMRAKSRIRPGQALVVSVAGAPQPGGTDAELADDYARCARWAADAGADVVEVHLGCTHPSLGSGSMPMESPPLAGYIVERVRRAVGQHPVVAKLGAARSPRALHEVATRLAPWVDGFSLVDGLPRRVAKADGRPVFPGAGREVAGISGADVYDHCRIQVEELLAWRKAGAWSRVILAGGGVTTTDRARALLSAGADAVMVATAALVDPLLAVRFRTQGGAQPAATL